MAAASRLVAPLVSSFFLDAGLMDSRQSMTALQRQSLCHQQRRTRIQTTAENPAGMRRRHFRRRQDADTERARLQEKSSTRGKPRDKRKSDAVPADSLGSAWERITSSVSPALDDLKKPAR